MTDGSGDAPLARVLSETLRSYAEATADPHRLMEIIARRTSESLGAFCGLSLVSEDGLWLTPAASFDPDEAKHALLRSAATTSPLRLDQPNPLARSMQTGEPTVMPAVTPEQLRGRFSRPEDQAAVGLLDIKNVLFVPLRARAQTVGGFSIVRHGANTLPFDRAEIRAIQTLADHAALAVLNARLVATAQRELADRVKADERLRVLTELAQEFSALTSDYARLVDLVTERISQVMDGLCALRFAKDGTDQIEESGTLFHPDAAVRALVRDFMSENPQRLGEGVTGRVMATGEPLLLTELSGGKLAAAIDDRSRAFIERLNLGSLMAVPLRSRNASFGAIVVSRTPLQLAFTEHDLKLLQEVAAHAGLAIKNARLLAARTVELAERTRLTERLRMLSEVAKEFSAATGEPAQLFELVARRIGERMGDLCTVRLVSADGTMLDPVGCVHHADPEIIAAANEVMLLIPQPVGVGATGTVAKTGEPLLIPTTSAEEFASKLDAKYAAFIAKTGLSSLMAVPLRLQGRVMGVISLGRTRAGAPYGPDDLELLEDLAAHASLAIANSRLLEASRLELANRMRTEEVLRHGFLEAAPDAVLIVDARGQIVLVNSQTETLFGYARAELVGRPIEALVPVRLRANHPRSRAGYVNAPSTRPMGAGLNLFAVRKDGTEFAAEISLSPIDTPEGKLVAAAVRDVTERRKELEERNRRMQEANRLKSEFLANMSHELRTPLNAIIGFTALMHSGKTGPLAEVHHEYLGDILTSSRHLLQLINDVLDLAKVESGRMELRVERVDLGTVAGEVRDILRGLVAERRIQLTMVVDAALGPVNVDQRLLKQVLYNYLSNAIKFTPAEGRVALRITPADGETFRIDVEDTGIGVRPDDLARLFIEFQQLDEGTAKRYPGTGLGLALTKRIVEAQGGQVSVKSEPGRGSTFSAVLPRDVKPSTGHRAPMGTSP
ncbi:MAG: GAF domain-containing protein [Archangium sp.]|nr:GAF domain-containing protein [Archangium sp.]